MTYPIRPAVYFAAEEGLHHLGTVEIIDHDRADDVVLHSVPAQSFNQASDDADFARGDGVFLAGGRRAVAPHLRLRDVADDLALPNLELRLRRDGGWWWW